MDRLARLPVGRITFQSVIRRHALWAFLSCAVSISLYFLVKVIAKFVYSKGGKYVPVFTAAEFSLYLGMCASLIVWTYMSYVSDRAKFGGTGIGLRSFKNTMLTSILLPLVLGVMCGKALIDIFHWLPISPVSMLTFRSETHLVPAIVGAVSLLMFSSYPAPASALQATPKPISLTYVTNVVSSAQKAAVGGVRISASVSAVLFVLRSVETLIVSYTCSSPSRQQLNPFCKLFVTANNTYDVYLPKSSVWMDAAAGLFVSAVLFFLLELLRESLVFMSTYPMDFQKLRVQLLRAEGTKTNGSGGINEQLLLQALMVGQEAVATSSTTTSESNSTSSSSNYCENTALSEAQAQSLRQAVLVESVVHAGTQPSLVPYFGEATDIALAAPPHRKFPTNVAANNTFQLPVPPVRRVQPVGNFDLLARSLAFQDLQRLVGDPSEVAAQRRTVLFTKHWAQVLAATCGMIDATALQIHLLDDYLTKREPDESVLLNEADQQEHLKITQELAETSTLLSGLPSTEPPHGSSFDNLLKLRAHLATTNGSGTSSSAKSTGVSASLERNTAELRQRPMYSREASSQQHQATTKAILYGKEVLEANQFVNSLLEWAYLGFYSTLRVPIPGYGVQYAADLPVRAFPPMCAASAVYAIDSISGLLLCALREDSAGYTQRAVCPVVRSLLTLEASLAGYCSTLQASQFVRIASMGRTQQIRYRARSESAIPESIRSMQGAVQEALVRVVRAYRDVLLLVVTQYNSPASDALFSRTQVTALEARLLSAV